MDTTNNCEYKCIECSKEYKAYKSLWEHNRVHHDGRKVEKLVKTTLCEVIVAGKYPCRKCPLTYKHRQTRYAHEKNCTGVATDQNAELESVKLIALKKQQNILNNERITLESEIEKRELLTKRMNECMNAILKHDERDEQDKEEIDKIYKEMEQIFEEKIKIFIEKKEFIKLVQKNETQKKLQNFLLNLNQARIQSKFF